MDEHAVRRDARGSLSPREAWALLATLGGLVVLNVPFLGLDDRDFRPGRVDPQGILGPLVRLADERWELGPIRAPAMVAGLLVALAAGWLLVRGRVGPRVATALAVAVVALLLLPALLLQAGLRQSTAPWFYVNDSTYQIELGGELIRDGENPYGHDYFGSGLERWYSFDGSVRPGTREREVALRHYAYFPGTALLGAAWGVLPEPLSDFRILVGLAALGLFGAALLLRAPLGYRLALGAALAASPIAVWAAWFGFADAPSLLCLVLAFALLLRGRFVWAAALLALAILVKQFAIVALPFFAVLWLRRAPVAARWPAAAAFAGVLLAGFLPFLVAAPGALWDDTVAYGAETYRVIGYGLAGLLVEAGVIGRRTENYPFTWLALFVWLPATALLLRAQLRSRAAWTAAAGFAVSTFLLFFVARVFQTSYLAWPLTGALLALGLYLDERGRAAA